jgi:hypothetical protein
MRPKKWAQGVAGALRFKNSVWMRMRPTPKSNQRIARM